MNGTESDLAARCLDGDEAAFGSLHAACAGRVKAYFLRSGFAVADADDLTQEVFERAFRSLRAFTRARESFGAWLASIAQDVARRQSGRRADPEAFDPIFAGDVFAANTGSAAEAGEEAAALSQCIDALPPELARALHLRYVKGMTARGVAAAVGISEADVRLRLNETLSLLRSCLKAKGFLE